METTTQRLNDTEADLNWTSSAPPSSHRDQTLTFTAHGGFSNSWINHTLNDTVNTTVETWLAPGLGVRWPFLFLVFIMVVSLLGNLFVVIAVCAHDKLRTTFYYMLASLAVCDLLNTLFVMPISLTKVILGELPAEWCIGWLTADYVITAATFTHLWLAVCNIHAALLRPLKYQLRQATVYATLNIIVACLLAVILGVAPLIVLIYHKSEIGPQCHLSQAVHVVASTVAPFYLPVIILIVLHAWVSVVLRRQTNVAKILSNENASIFSTSNGDVTFDNMELKCEAMGNGSVRKHRGITRMGSNDSCNSISDAEDEDHITHTHHDHHHQDDKERAEEGDPPPTPTGDGSDGGGEEGSISEGTASTGDVSSISDSESLRNDFANVAQYAMKKQMVQAVDSVSSDINSISDLDLRYAIAKNINKGALGTSISNFSTDTGLSYLANPRESDGSISVGTSFDADKHEADQTIRDKKNAGATPVNEDGLSSSQVEIQMTEENASDKEGCGDADQGNVEQNASEPSKSETGEQSDTPENLNPGDESDEPTDAQNYEQEPTQSEPQIPADSPTHDTDGDREKEDSDNTEETSPKKVAAEAKDERVVEEKPDGKGEGMGRKRRSKEELNEPLADAGDDFHGDPSIDTQKLIDSLEEEKEKRENFEDNTAFEESEGGGDDTPLTNAIRVRRTSPDGSSEGESIRSNSSGSDNGSVKKKKHKRKTSSHKKPKSREGSLTKEEKEKKNKLCMENEVNVLDPKADKMHLSYPPTRQPSRMSQVSYGSAPGPDGKRRSILRRDGSSRNSGLRKSVKFSSEKNTEHPIPRCTKRSGEAKRISTRRKTPRKRRRPSKVMNGSARSNGSGTSAGSESSDPGKPRNGVSRGSSTASSNGSLMSGGGRRAPKLARQNTVLESTKHAVVIGGTQLMPELENMDYMTRVHHTQGMKMTLRFKRQKNVLENVVVILVVYLLLSLPNIVVNTLVSTCQTCTQAMGVHTLNILIIATEWVRLSSSAVMPILYILISPDFRSALKKFCLRKSIDRTNSLGTVKY